MTDMRADRFHLFLEFVWPTNTMKNVFIFFEFIYPHEHAERLGGLFVHTLVGRVAGQKLHQPLFVPAAGQDGEEVSQGRAKSGAVQGLVYAD